MDSRRLKCLVYGLYFWDVLQTAMYTSSMFVYLGSGWGDFALLESIQTTWFNVPLMSGVGQTYHELNHIINSIFTESVILIQLALLFNASMHGAFLFSARTSGYLDL